jgi:ABC-type Mn2+/Zn2+ transport system permease subunit
MLLLIILILFAIISAHFGCFILWNKITNYFDSFGHSAIFAASIASLFHLSEMHSLMIFSFIFSCILFACIYFNIKLNNTLLIVISSAFIASGVLIKDYHEKIHHEHDHEYVIEKEKMNQKLFFKEKILDENNKKNDIIEDYVGCIHENEENNFFDFLIGMPLQKWPLKKILLIAFYLILIFILSLFFAKNWLKNIINKNIYVKKRFDRISEFMFLSIIGFFSIIMVKFSGVLFAVSLSIFPALISNYFEKGPIKTISIAIIINIIFTIIAYFLIIYNDAINFNIALLFLQFFTFIGVSLFKKINQISVTRN